MRAAELVDHIESGPASGPAYATGVAHLRHRYDHAVLCTASWPEQQQLFRETPLSAVEDLSGKFLSHSAFGTGMHVAKSF